MSMRRKHRYVTANRRRHSRRGRLRRNQTVFGADLMNDIAIPVAAGATGFIGARVVSNALANLDAVRNILDSGKTAADADNTKIAANLLGILATLGIATKVPLVKRNQGALITGMGLALVDRLIAKLGGSASQYLSGFGEYVNQPMGEYVNQPLSSYVQDPSMGEYVNQPMSGLGTMYATAGLGTMYATAGLGTLYAAAGLDPSDQRTVDGLMDVMEAAAGTEQAAAGFGTLYAAAGLGDEADAGLQQMYAKMQPPFASIQTPTDLAQQVVRDMPYDKPVPASLVTPEGRGYAGGLFARTLFSGMF
jgi:hypothetical protein